MNITIRKANPDEWTIVQKLNHEVFVSEAPNDPHLDMSWPFSEEGISRYKKFVTDQSYLTLIAFDGNTAVGHIVGGPKVISYRAVKIAEIEEIGVSPTHRSQGIGAELIKKLRAWCRENGYQKLDVNAYSKNTKGIAFYERQGMKPIDMDLEMDV